METRPRHLETWNLFLFSWQIKNIELNHNYALAKPNVQAEHAGLTPRLTAQHLISSALQPPLITHCVPSFCPRNHQNPRQPMTRSRQMRCHAAIVLVNDLPSLFATDVTQTHATGKQQSNTAGCTTISIDEAPWNTGSLLKKRPINVRRLELVANP